MNYKQNKFKAVIVGNSNVGKSSILSRLVNTEYNNQINPTIGLDYFAYRFIKDNYKIKLVLWDTAGQEQFNSIIKLYFKDVNILIVVADITDSKSCNDIEKWILKVIKENNNITDLPILVIFNKIDLRNNNTIQINDCELIYKRLIIRYKKLEYIEVSAKNNLNFDKFKDILSNMIINKYEIELIKTESNNDKNSNDKFCDNICIHDRYQLIDDLDDLDDLDEPDVNNLNCCNIS